MTSLVPLISSVGPWCIIRATVSDEAALGNQFGCWADRTLYILTL